MKKESGIKKEKFAQLKQQKERAEVAKRLMGRIGSALADLEQQREKADEAEKVVADLVRRKQDLAADLALGESSQADVAAVDQELKAAKSIASELAAAVSSAEGFERKLEDAKRELHQADEAVKYATDAYLLAEAEEIGEEYAEAAQTLARCFGRLSALALLHEPRRVSGGPIGVGPITKDFCIPVFQLESLQSLASPSARYKLAAGEEIANGMFMNKALQEEEARLRDLGVIS
ncbi:MAG: hypothetical protein AB7F21_07545 [Desulfuromonadales bacterium]